MACAQDDGLLAVLGEEDTGPEHTMASFNSTRVINGHSLENTANGVLDFRIGHRFGLVNSGVGEFFGLDAATVRLGLDHGITDRLMVGIGRSSYQKTVDGFVKYRLLRQCHTGCGTPLTLAVVASSSLNTLRHAVLPWYVPGTEDVFAYRLAYSWQLIVGRKFSERVTLQLNPGVVHRNLVPTEEEPNDILHLSGAGRMKLGKRVALTAEYFHVLPGQLSAGYRNSLSMGLDIDTGGHVFQLHATNSTAMFEQGFITGTTGDWGNGDIHFGFNISRVFTVRKPGRKG